MLLTPEMSAQLDAFLVVPLDSNSHCCTQCINEMLSPGRLIFFLHMFGYEDVGVFCRCTLPCPAMCARLILMHYVAQYVQKLVICN